MSTQFSDYKYTYLSIATCFGLVDHLQRIDISVSTVLTDRLTSWQLHEFTPLAITFSETTPRCVVVP